MSFRLFGLPFGRGFGRGFGQGGGGGVPAQTDAQFIASLNLILYLKTQTGFFQDVAQTTPAVAADPVGAWADASGNSRHYTQSVALNKPTLTSLSGVLAPVGDGTTDYLSNASNIGNFANGNYTIFITFKPSAANGGVFGVGALASATPWIFCFYLPGTQKLRFNHRDDASVELSGGAWDIDAPSAASHVVSIVRNGTSFKQRIDGNVELALTATIGATTLDQSRVLATASTVPANFFGSGAYSIAIAATALTDSQRLRMESIMLGEIGITLPF